jgi:hypothetical protein
MPLRTRAAARLRDRFAADDSVLPTASVKRVNQYALPLL